MALALCFQASVLNTDTVEYMILLFQQTGMIATIFCSLTCCHGYASSCLICFILIGLRINCFSLNNDLTTVLLAFAV